MRGVRERRAPRPAAAAERGPRLDRLGPQRGEVPLGQRLAEAHREGLGAEPEQRERLGEAGEGGREVLGGFLSGSGRVGRARCHARVDDGAQRGRRGAARGRRCHIPRVGGRRGGAGGGPRHRRLLWPLLEQRERPLGEAVGQRLHEVRVEHPAMRTRHRVRVVGVVQPLLRV